MAWTDLFGTRVLRTAPGRYLAPQANIVVFNFGSHVCTVVYGRLLVELLWWLCFFVFFKDCLRLTRLG